MADQMRQMPCAPQACASCPWRKSNQGKPHPHGWYDQSNLDRLWRGLRTGEAPGMTCHPTDTNNLVPEGHRAPPDSAYPRRFPFLSKNGVFWWVFSRCVLAGTPLGADSMPVLEDDPDIYYAPLARARKEARDEK